MTEVRRRQAGKREEPRVIYSRDELKEGDSLSSNELYDTPLWLKCCCMTFFAFCGLLCAVVIFFYINPSLFWHLWEHPDTLSKFGRLFLAEDQRNGDVRKSSSWMAEASELSGPPSEEEKQYVAMAEDGHCTAESNACANRQGHMRPIGEHRKPNLEISVLPFMLSSRDFYKHYVRSRRPVVFRDAIRNWPAYRLWQNESYLREKYGETHFRVEPMKFFTNLSYPLHHIMTLNEFLDRYQTESIYLDSPCPTMKLTNDVFLPDCLLCEEMQKGVSSVTLLISSGNTSSSLHHDGYENLIALISGSKTMMLFNTSESRMMYGDQFINHPAVSPIEPDSVDLDRFPLFGGTHYGMVTLNAGDMLYIPQNWWHHVRSEGNTTIGFNIWWAQFNFENQMTVEGLNEDVDVTAVIELFDRMVEKEPLEILCSNQQTSLAKAMKDIDFGDLVIPRKVKKPPNAILASNYEMPMLGFGTAGLFGERAVSSVKHALKVGYKLIDSAQGYDEVSVGRGIVESGINRSSLFVVSKLHPRYLGYETTLEAVRLSLKNLHTDYLDAFLIHSIDCDDGEDARLPCGPGEPKGTWQESWKAMEKLQREGVIRSLGVSNFDVNLLRELLKLTEVPVSIVQNWFDPFYQDHVVRQLCSDNRIAYMGYSTLGTAWKESGVIDFNPVLEDKQQIMHIAVEHEATISQVVLRWAMDSNVIVIPRSSNPLHININLLAMDIELAEHEMSIIEKMEGKIMMPDEELQEYYEKLQEQQAWDDEEGKQDVPEDIPVGEPMVHKTVEENDSVIFIASDDGIMYALEAATGAVHWLFRTEDEVGSSATLSRDGKRLYFGSDDGHIYCLSVSNGEVMWKFNTGDAVTASPLLTPDDTILCGSQNGKFFGLSSLDGSMLYERTLKGPIWSSASVSSQLGIVYVGSLSEDSDNFYALRSSDGSVVWSYRTSIGVWATPRVTSDGKTVIFGDQSGLLYAFDAASGTQRWTLATNGGVVESSAAISEKLQTVFVGTRTAGLLAVDLVTGKLNWLTQFEGEIVSSPLLRDGVIYFGTENGDIMAVLASNRKKLWQFKANDSVMSSPRIDSSGTLYIGSVDSMVYALDSLSGSMLWKHSTYGPVVATAAILNV